MQYNYKALTNKLLAADEFTLAQQCLKSIDNYTLTGQLIRRLAKSYTHQPKMLLELLSIFFKVEVVISDHSFITAAAAAVAEPVESAEPVPNKLYIVADTLPQCTNKIQELILVCLHRLDAPASSKEIVKFSQRIIQYFTDESTRDHLMETYETSGCSRLTALIRSNTRILVRAGHLDCDKSLGYGKFKYTLSSTGLSMAESLQGQLNSVAVEA